jgi:error-prone DNA polymerase
VIEVAIVRPGPIQGNMVHPYLKRREGCEPVEYPSEALRDVLEKTLGVPLFQEQAMQIAIIGAGFTPDEADALRRALATFRHVGTISLLRERFLAGMRANGYADDFAERCFSQIEGFGTYGFPEAHAISFANLVYVSAWLKCHYPDAFCAALLNSQPMGFYAPAQLVRDARDHGVKILPIDVNHSSWETTLEPVAGGSLCAVRLGLHMVSGLAENEGKRVAKVREESGVPYESPEQLARRASCNHRTMDRLAQADTFASMNTGRRQALWKIGAVEGKLPPLFAATTADLFHEPEADLPAATDSQEVVADYLSAGLSLRNHPLTFLRRKLKAKRAITAAELKNTPAKRMVIVAGLVLFRQRPGTAKETMFITLEDETGAVNLIVWKHVHEKHHKAVVHSQLIACWGEVQREGQVLHVVARHVWDWSPMLQGLDPDESAPAIRLRSRDFR